MKRNRKFSFFIFFSLAALFFVYLGISQMFQAAFVYAEKAPIAKIDLSVFLYFIVFYFFALFVVGAIGTGLFICVIAFTKQ